MNNDYVINDYLNDDINNLEKKNRTLEALNVLKKKIENAETISELKNEVLNYLDNNDISLEFKNDIKHICDGFLESFDLLTARGRLDDYLSHFIVDKNNTVSNETIIDNDSNKTNFDGYYYERNKFLNSVKTDDKVASMDTGIEVESPKDDIILSNTSENNEIKDLELFKVNSDGTVQINGSFKNYESLNFANDQNKIKKLDMKFIKEKNDINNFKIIYGDFPIDHTKSKPDNELISKIEKLIKSYKSNNDYMSILKQKSKEISEAMLIIYSYVLGRTGMFQMSIRDNGKKYDMAFGMDQEYSDILDAFNINGAFVSYEGNMNGIVTVNETIPGNQLLILNSTNETLNASDNKNNFELKEEKGYVKKIDSNQAAHANYTLLIVMGIIEVILLSIYFIFLFNK